MTDIDKQIDLRLERFIGKKKMEEATKKEQLSELSLNKRLEITKEAIKDDQNKLKFLSQLETEIKIFLECVDTIGSETNKIMNLDHVLLTISKYVFWSKRKNREESLKRKFRRLQTIRTEDKKEIEEFKKYTKIYKGLYKYVWLIRNIGKKQEKIIHFNQNIFTSKFKSCENSQGMIFFQID